MISFPKFDNLRHNFLIYKCNQIKSNISNPTYLLPYLSPNHLFTSLLPLPYLSLYPILPFLPLLPFSFTFSTSLSPFFLFPFLYPFPSPFLFPFPSPFLYPFPSPFTFLPLLWVFDFIQYTPLQ